MMSNVQKGLEFEEKGKKLLKKFGYKYAVAGCNRYFNNIKSQQKLLGDIKKKEAELNELNKKLIK